MKSIVDVVCHSTSEVLKEGVSLEAARAFIAEKEGKVVKDEIVQTLWVEIPEVMAEFKKHDSNAKRSREFWNPMRES